MKDIPDDDCIIPHPLWKAELSFGDNLDGALAEKISEALEDVCLSVFIKNLEATDGDSWTVTVTTMGEPDKKALEEKLGDIAKPASITVEKLPETDWLQHVHQHFPPVTLGKFFIYGSHYEGDIPPATIPLKIDAATAFGSGEHETTKGCLLALEKLSLQEKFANGLDMGCGSGILAIAMQKLWPAIKVTAIDIDPESVTVAKRHAAMNGVALQAQAGDGYQAPLCQEEAPYDLVAANILAGPLVAMADDLAKALKAGGFAVLSGLLARQEEEVKDAQEAAGLSFVKAIPIGEWRALVFRKA